MRIAAAQVGKLGDAIRAAAGDRAADRVADTTGSNCEYHRESCLWQRRSAEALAGRGAQQHLRHRLKAQAHFWVGATTGAPVVVKTHGEVRLERLQDGSVDFSERSLHIALRIDRKIIATIVRSDVAIGHQRIRIKAESLLAELGTDGRRERSTRERKHVPADFGVKHSVLNIAA